MKNSTFYLDKLLPVSDLDANFEQKIGINNPADPLHPCRIDPEMIELFDSYLVSPNNKSIARILQYAKEWANC